nr:hypothetical protein CFP56_52755 [Quercus suber]
MSDQANLDHRSGSTQSESAQGSGEDLSFQDSDDEPMVYETPRDYATWARQERERLIAEGAAPDSVILMSEVPNHVPRQEGESPEDFTKRYVATMNAMIRRGVSILNDRCTADVVPNQFTSSNGMVFELGPKSGATKGDYREFKQWFSGLSDGVETHEVPERWLRFLKPGVETS